MFLNFFHRQKENSQNLRIAKPESATDLWFWTKSVSMYLFSSTLVEKLFFSFCQFKASLCDLADELVNCFIYSKINISFISLNDGFWNY